MDILYNNNYILQVYIITFDAANVECGFHDIEHFLPDQHKKEKKKVEKWKANYSKYRGASLFTEIPINIHIGMKITTQHSKCYYFHELTQ